MIEIKVGGVPEHFNYPWHYGIANGIFEKYGIKITWSDVKGGSGAMCKMLDTNELDIALVLTEGIVKHIHGGSECRIIQQYVKSPLIWGVHSAVGRKFSSKDLSQARIARSRFGSGSHLMAYVHAEQKGYEISEDSFVTVQNIDGAIASFERDESDILLWERFMTQPYVNENKVDRIELCISPWPCFMMVAGPKYLNKQSETIELLSSAILESINKASKMSDIVEKIAEMYGLGLSQVKQWYSGVEWQSSNWLSSKMLDNVTETLHRVGLVEQPKLEAANLCIENANLY